MNLNEYVVWTDSVAKYPQTAESYYLALGMADEYGEVMNLLYNEPIGPAADKVVEGIIKEIGDVLWYLVRYGRNVLKLDVEATTLRLAEDARNDQNSSEVDYQIQQGASMTIHIGALCGFEKKKLRDGDTWDVDKKIMKQLAAVDSWKKLMYGFLHMIAYFEVSMQEVIDVNQGKLAKRLEEGTIKGDGDNR